MPRALKILGLSQDPDGPAWTATYPLTGIGCALGVLVAALVTVWSDSVLNGLAAGSIFALVGLTWRRDEAPVFPFIVGFQWLAVVIGRTYESVLGPLPVRYLPGDLKRAVALSLVGLLLLAIGIRVGSGNTHVPKARETDTPGGAAKILFWIVLGLYSIDYFGGINPKDFGGLDQIIAAALACRQAFLMALWYEVMAGRGGWRYIAISFVFVFLPSVGNYFSTFKGPVVLLFLVAATFWQPWKTIWWRRGAPKVLLLVPVAALVLLMAVVWQAGVKQETRRAFDTTGIGNGVNARVRFFTDRAKETLPLLWEDPQAAVGELVSRISYVTFFSRVLDHVPRAEPFAHGELLKMALVNAFMPRALFPDKPVLPSDSYYTRRFAGANVAEGMTSISIGYMAEFYADWGTIGLFVSTLAYGLLMGFASRALRAFIRPALFIDGAIAAVFLSVTEFEHQFIKGFAAINIGAIGAVAIFFALRPWLGRVVATRAGMRVTAPVTAGLRAPVDHPSSAS